jgi:hypothetical protein
MLKKSDFTFTRGILYNRHQLSHEQIDEWLGENRCMEFPQTKMNLLPKLSEFLSVSELFRKEGIRSIPLKGPLLSHRLYGDATARLYFDLDFFMEAGLVVHAVTILKEKGYSAVFFDIPREKCQQKIFYRHIKEIYLYHPEKEVSIEIKWNLFGGRIIDNSRMLSVISGHLQPYEFKGTTFRVFTPAFELLFLVIHGGLHAWRRLKWLVDVKDYLERIPFDETEFIGLTKQFHAERMVTVCNEILKCFFPGFRLLPSTTPFRGPARMPEYILEQIQSEEYETPKSFAGFMKNTWYTLAAFPGVKFKRSILDNKLFASYVARNAEISCFPFIYYFVVPFQKIGRSFGKVKSEE